MNHLISELIDNELYWDRLPKARKFSKKPNHLMINNQHIKYEILNGQPVAVVYDKSYILAYLEDKLKCLNLQTSAINEIYNIVINNLDKA